MTLAQRSYTLAERWSKAENTSEFSATDINGMDANQIGEYEYSSRLSFLIVSYQLFSSNDYSPLTHCQQHTLITLVTSMGW